MYLTDEKAIKLACCVLERTWIDYTEALKTIMEFREEYFTVAVPKREKQREFFRNHNMTKQPRLVDQRDKYVIRMYEEAVYTKHNCEAFYRGDRYQVYTCAKGLPPEEVIARAKKETNYQECNVYEYEKEVCDDRIN